MKAPVETERKEKQPTTVRPKKTSTRASVKEIKHMAEAIESEEDEKKRIWELIKLHSSKKRKKTTAKAQVDSLISFFNAQHTLEPATTTTKKRQTTTEKITTQETTTKVVTSTESTIAQTTTKSDVNTTVETTQRPETITQRPEDQTTEKKSPETTTNQMTQTITSTKSATQPSTSQIMSSESGKTDKKETDSTQPKVEEKRSSTTIVPKTKSTRASISEMKKIVDAIESEEDEKKRIWQLIKLHSSKKRKKTTAKADVDKLISFFNAQHTIDTTTTTDTTKQTTMAPILTSRRRGDCDPFCYDLSIYCETFATPTYCNSGFFVEDRPITESNNTYINKLSLSSI